MTEGGSALPALLLPWVVQVQRDLGKIFQIFLLFQARKKIPQQISEHRKILSWQRRCWRDGCTQAAQAWLPQKMASLASPSWLRLFSRSPRALPESQDGWCQTGSIISSPACSARTRGPLATPAPMSPRSGLGAGCLGCRGWAKRRKPAPRPLAGASSRPDARRGSGLLQEQFRGCFNVSQNAGNKRNFNGVEVELCTLEDSWLPLFVSDK